VLCAKSELLNNYSAESEQIYDRIEPVILGGGTVSDTTHDSYSLLGAPESFEAGIPNYPAQIAAGTAVDYLQQIGMDRISEQESQLNSFLTKELLSRYGDLGWFKILGPGDPSQRGSILAFEVRRPNAIGIATELNRRNNVMIRDGAFCVHSYFNDQYGQGWLRPKSHKDHRMIYRVSLYFYNTIEECQAFAETLDEIFTERCYI
jgi:cysteine desulfurase / selenocysteine lyase